MSTPIESYFDRIFVLTLKRRTDRIAKMKQLLHELEIHAEFFFGYDKPTDHNGNPSGNKGCSESHRALLEIIAYKRWKRVLILEDDCEIAFTSPEMTTLVDPQEQFSKVKAEIPEHWDMLFLGGQYADNPQRRVSPHVIKFNKMLTTSSYGITWQMAREMAPYISGVGPIDSLYGGFQPNHNCYILQPRLFTQGKSLSDLTDRIDDNQPCMLDTRHEEMLMAGAWRTRLDGAKILDTEINRREIAGPNDMNGSEVIVDGILYTVVSTRLPQHPAPWRRGESVSYELAKV